jgi:hypothetical protein
LFQIKKDAACNWFKLSSKKGKQNKLNETATKLAASMINFLLAAQFCTLLHIFALFCTQPANNSRFKPEKQSEAS